MNKHSRRRFLKISGGAAAAVAAPALLSRRALAARANERNILCWEGYNSDEALDPFRRMTGAKVQAESGTSDPDMINKLRAGEINVWDVINLNQPWAREQMYPEKLIKPIPRDKFEPYMETMLPAFHPPYKWALSLDGKDLLGMTHRFGPFNVVVTTN